MRKNKPIGASSPDSPILNGPFQDAMAALRHHTGRQPGLSGPQARSALVVSTAKAKAERTLKLKMDDEAFERVYGFVSHPVATAHGRRLAVRVGNQFGEEGTKVVVL